MRRALARCAALATVALAASGCVSVPSSGGALIDRHLAEIGPMLEVSSLEAGQWALEFRLPASPPTLDLSLDAAERIRAVNFVVYRPGGIVIDSLTRGYVDIDSAAIARLRPDSLYAFPLAYSGVKWIPRGIPSGDEYVMMSVWTDRGVDVQSAGLFETIRRTFDRSDSTLALEMTSAPAGGRLSARLVARRIAPYHRGEFRSLRQPYSVRLLDEDGNVVWTSAAPEGESLHIGPLLPDRVGDSLAFETSFDGIDRRNRRPLSPGRYRLEGEVLAHPRRYVIQQEIDWGGR